jgi:hypothetical protein
MAAPAPNNLPRVELLGRMIPGSFLLIAMHPPVIFVSRQQATDTDASGQWRGCKSRINLLNQGDTAAFPGSTRASIAPTRPHQLCTDGPQSSIAAPKHCKHAAQISNHAALISTHAALSSTHAPNRCTHAAQLPIVAAFFSTHAAPTPHRC